MKRSLSDFDDEIRSHMELEGEGATGSHRQIAKQRFKIRPRRAIPLAKSFLLRKLLPSRGKTEPRILELAAITRQSQQRP